MIERGMIPLGSSENKERDNAIRSMPKKTNSPKGSISQKIARIKDGTTKDVDKALMELVRNPETSAVQLTKLSNEMVKSFPNLSSKNQIALLKVLNDRYKTLFGGKLSLDANVNMNTSDVIMNRLSEWKVNGGAEPVEYEAPTQEEEQPIETTGTGNKDNEQLAQWKKDQAPQTIEEPGYDLVEPEVTKA